ncbi:unnamed protein product [Eruca vesicaria subsp. sativa]|uniref:Uncharacterized protein n=1 Tax=Eruca vesicaria subsp. sativa TaxID=29727 RepID=A0ABC8KPA6_ERUVS|nr:unnamed protein product [Eruca vesicaria subsp. sativa]
MQPQSGGIFRPRLNIGERPIANKYRERVKECLKLSGGKRMGAGDRPGRMGAGDRPGRMRNGAIRSANRFGAWNDVD